MLQSFLPLSNEHLRIIQADSFISRAELLICEGNSVLALQQYLSAFNVYGNRMSSRNLYHLYITAIDAGQMDAAEHALRMLKCRGWAREAFCKFLSRFYDEGQLKLLKVQYDNCTTDGCFMNRTVRAEIDSTVYNDWSMNKRYIESKCNPARRKALLDSFRKLTCSQIQYLAELAKSAFVSDALIGRAYPFSDAPYDILLLHHTELQGWHYSWPSVKLFYKLLFRAVKEGYADADDFEQYVSSPAAFDRSVFQCRIDSISLTFPLNNRAYFRINDSLFEWIRDDISTYEYNRRRKAIPGLGDVETFRRKFIFQFYNPKYRFVSNVYLLNLSPMPDSLKRQLKFIKNPN